MDFARGSLLPVVVGNGEIERVRIRDDRAWVRTVSRPYCGGTPPPPPTVVMLRVPTSVQTVESQTRHVGRCPKSDSPPM